MPLYPLSTPKLGFVHMPKTGGTWVGRVLREQFRWRNVGGGHDPAWYRPDYTRLPECDALFGTIRDPWTWYCSLWRYAHRKERTKQALKAWGNGSLSFRDVLYGWTHPGDVHTLPSTLGVVFQPVNHAEARARLSRVSYGLWTWTVAYMYGNGCAYDESGFGWDVAILLDMHNLKNDLSLVLQSPILATPEQNSSERVETEMGDASYSDWYDADMIHWVKEADGKMNQHFEYTEDCLCLS